MKKLSYKTKYELLKIAIALPIVVSFWTMLFVYPFMK